MALALRRRCTTIHTVAGMENTINTTSTANEDGPVPGRPRRLATKLLVGAGTVGVVLLTSEHLVLAGRVAEQMHKREPAR